MSGSDALPEGLRDLFADYLARQRWYAGAGAPARLAVLDSRQLPAAPGLGTTTSGGPAMWWAVVDADGVRYQLLVGGRPEGESADFLTGHEAAVLGTVGQRYYYDAALDPDLSLHLLEVVSGGDERAARVRPITAEQSNTSLVYDDRVIMKVFRRLLDGPNPDVAVTTALAAAGFEQVAAPVAAWREGGVDFMFAQQYLAGGSEGWALAVTSLRDFFGEAAVDPGEAGGDFASEAGRLGRMTARMHVTLAGVYGVEPLPAATATWRDLVDDIDARLRSFALGGPDRIDALLARLRAVGSPIPATRVHGDFHLGQVMRTDAGWYVLDFEGEPARALDARVTSHSPLRDVAGMLRSLHYASRFALRERADSELERLESRAEVWERHNCAAFLAGYHADADVGLLLPDDPVVGSAVLAAYQLDKALYELAYERAYRPDWEDIPAGAIARILAGDSLGGAEDPGS